MAMTDGTRAPARLRQRAAARGKGASQAPVEPRALPPRHVPQRTCIGCRREAGKRGLVRIVRTEDQRVVVDPTGKARGRGAYLCALRPCWEKALKGGTIAYALRVTPAREDIAALKAYGTTLPAEEGEIL
jgi:predicted RNA-binding protein YlxR (DUF448 family)